jgi:hypothetical protein
MIYTKHFKLKIEQHEPKKNVGEPIFSGNVNISCSTEAPVMLHSLLLLMSASCYTFLLDYELYRQWGICMCDRCIVCAS